MEELELDERKTKILNAIIRNYLETGEPVGSRTISKYTDLNLSSATIRNEMADLEELGYILQPHTSAVCHRTHREDGTGTAEGCKSSGSQYQLCNNGISAELSSEQSEVHSAL